MEAKRALVGSVRSHADAARTGAAVRPDARRLTPGAARAGHGGRDARVRVTVDERTGPLVTRTATATTVGGRGAVAAIVGGRGGAAAIVGGRGAVAAAFGGRGAAAASVGGRGAVVAVGRRRCLPDAGPGTVVTSDGDALRQEADRVLAAPAATP